MAATRLIPMRRGKGKTIAASIKDRTDYAENPDKTRAKELVSAYECDPLTVDTQFLLSKKQYASITGREQKRESDILAYQIRQSFKPGEVTPEQANQIGYQLATAFTKGKHQFIVATHIDKAHIHCHIIFNSTSIDGTRKFRNFWGSSLTVRKISDRICLENGLSVIENAGKNGRDYGGWLGDRKAPSGREKLCRAIDVALAEKPADFSAFLRAMEASGYEIKRGKNLAFRVPGQKKFTRCRSLDDDYIEQAIQERIEGRRPLIPSRKKTARRNEQRVNLLIDIQTRLQAGKGPGFEHWAKIFNLKQAAQTLNFLSENGLLEYAQLQEKTAQSAARFNELSDRIKGMESRLSEIAALKTQIANYVKTREVYVAYRKAGYSRKFYAEHEPEILLHKVTKQAFDALNVKKLPTIKVLQTEYGNLLTEKKKLYSEYAQEKKEMRELLTAKANVDRLLGSSSVQLEKGNER
jgi:hypothetical protein